MVSYTDEHVSEEIPAAFRPHRPPPSAAAQQLPPDGRNRCRKRVEPRDAAYTIVCRGNCSAGSRPS